MFTINLTFFDQNHNQINEFDIVNTVPWINPNDSVSILELDDQTFVIAWTLKESNGDSDPAFQIYSKSGVALTDVIKLDASPKQDTNIQLQNLIRPICHY